MSTVDALVCLDPPRAGEEAQSLLIEHGDPATIGLDTIPQETSDNSDNTRTLNSLAFIARNRGKRLASCHPARPAE